MKNLVSRNPVQRFKQGRKILKGEDGLGKNQYYYLGDNGIGIHDISQGINDDKRLTHRYIFNGKQYGSFDGGKQYYDLSSLKPLNFKSNQYLLSRINYKPTENGNIKKDKGKRNIITPIDNRFVSGFEGVRNDILNSGGVRAWQQKLKDFYDPGTYKEDGWWGANTQKAYEKYLGLQNIPTFTPEPVSSPEFKPQDAITPEIKEKIAMDGYTPNVVEQKVVSAPIIYNKSMTRDWLRNNIGTAYGVSGLTRRATKNALNRQLADGDLELIAQNQKLYDALKALGLFKKGGNILPSRNIVTRFKQRNFR